VYYTALGDIVASEDALQKLFSSAPEDIELAFELADLKRELDDRADAFNEQQRKYAEKYGVESPETGGVIFVKTDENGDPLKDDNEQYVPDVEAIAAFNEKMDALANKEVEFSRKVTRDEIKLVHEDIGLTVAELRRLDWLIGSDDEEPATPGEEN
jgi:hypothetical protein